MEGCSDRRVVLRCTLMLAVCAAVMGPVRTSSARTAIFDSNQRLVRTDDGHTITTYGYDALGALVSVDAHAHGEPSARRALIVDVSTSPVWRIVGEVAPNGNAALYAFGPTGLTAQTARNAGAAPSEPYYVLADHVGSVRAILNPAAVVRGRVAYEPYGARRARSGVASAFGFAGEWQSEDGVLHLRTRSCDTTTGRCMQRDTYPGSPAAPKSWNRYAYAEDNPIVLTDPTGESVAVTCNTGDQRPECQTVVRRLQSIADSPMLQNPRAALGAERDAELAASAPNVPFAPFFDNALTRWLEPHPEGCSAEGRSLLQGVGCSAGNALLFADVGRSLWRSPTAARSQPSSLLDGSLGDTRAYVRSFGAYAPEISPQFSNVRVSRGAAWITTTDGRTIVLSRRPVTWRDVARQVAELVQTDPRDIDVLSGAHGDEYGWLRPERYFLYKDYRILAFNGHDPRVRVHDVTRLSETELRAILQGPNNCVGGFCFSDRSRMVSRNMPPP